MSDLAFELLRQKLNANGVKNSLWLVDENISSIEIAAVQVADKLLAMTNRCDIAKMLESQGFTVLLNDFDCAEIQAQSLDAIYYRVSKEKALVHHIINSAASYLKPEGLLYLAGYKNEGAKTYIKKATKYLGGAVEKQRGSNASLLAAIQSSANVGQSLDDKDYRRCRSIADGEVSFMTKPGLYGWNKIDKGSEFLIEHLDAYLQTLKTPLGQIADLGCGYGYLSIMTSKKINAAFIACDNNISAVNLCRENFNRHELHGRVVLDDCAAGIEDKVDLLLCNPPFHQGFSVEGDLTDKFIESAKRLLKPRGSALFVVNSFIPLEKKASGLFSEIKQLANNGSFKLLSLSNSASL